MTNPRPTARDLAMQSADQQPMQIGGRPASACPHCGGGMFVNGVQRGDMEIVRYVECRACHRRFVTVQKPAVVIRELGS